MKTVVSIAAATVLAMAATSPAVAREGCGEGFHRTANGMCRANRGTEQRWIEGHYYHGQGYWHQTGGTIIAIARMASGFTSKP